MHISNREILPHSPVSSASPDPREVAIEPLQAQNGAPRESNTDDTLINSDELKLPNTSSLAIVIISNLLLQVRFTELSIGEISLSPSCLSSSLSLLPTTMLNILGVIPLFPESSSAFLPYSPPWHLPL